MLQETATLAATQQRGIAMGQFQHMAPETLYGLLNDPALQIVDIRDEASFAAGRVTGALHLDSHSLQSFIEEADLDEPIVVCCYHGHSSQQAATFLSERGFEEAYSLDGGFALWQSSYPEATDKD